jgi:hypothetical protein
MPAQAILFQMDVIRLGVEQLVFSCVRVGVQLIALVHALSVASNCKRQLSNATYQLIQVLI